MTDAQREAERVIVYRVQDADGRGPWKPGFSIKWVDRQSVHPLPADVVTAFGLGWRNEIPDGWACGCACLSMEALREWILPIERERLTAFGYAPVAMYADAIIRRNDDQVIFARKKRLTVGAMRMTWDETARRAAGK